MSILSNLTAIKIRGTYSPEGVGYLDDVQLETVSKGITASPATWIEQCNCPTGKSNHKISIKFLKYFNYHTLSFEVISENIIGIKKIVQYSEYFLCRLRRTALWVLRTRIQTFSFLGRTIHAMRTLWLQRTCRNLRIRDRTLHLPAFYFRRQLRHLR